MSNQQNVTGVEQVVTENEAVPTDTNIILGEHKMTRNNPKPHSIIIMLLIVVSISVAIYLTIQYLKLGSKSIVPPATPKAQKEQATKSKPVVTQSEDNDVDWLTYTNTDFGYSFQYPHELSVNLVGEPKPIDCVRIDMTLAHIAIKSDGGETGGCIETGRGALTEYTPTSEVVSIMGKNVTFDGYIGNSTDDQYESKKRSENIAVRGLRGDNFVIELGGKYNEDERDIYLSEKSTLLRVIETLTFSDDASSEFDITDWKSFSNSQMSFGYPANWKFGESGMHVVSPTGKVKIILAIDNNSLYNECMQLDSKEEVRGGIFVIRYSRVIDGGMCSAEDGSPRETWIVPGSNKYGPGLQYIYSTNDTPSDEQVFNQILASFKFL